MKKCNIAKTLHILLCALFFNIGYLSISGNVFADAISKMSVLLSGDLSEKNQSEEEKIETESRSCGPESVVPVETCEIGQGLLCINTPELSVSGNYIIIKGTVDKRTSVFSHFKVFSQHEYTKEFNEVQINDWSSDNCWEGSSIGSKNACLDSKGHFSVQVPLNEAGPYTIMIDAVSMDGEAVSRRVRTTRAVEPVVARDQITIDPDPFTDGNRISSPSVNVKVDLLGGCKFCDFIGTSTGGVMVTVENLIDSADGGRKRIVRNGNISSSGIYNICVPVVEGVNRLKISACNAATGADCPFVDNISFSVSNGGGGIEILSPEGPNEIYDSAKHSSVPLKFSVPDIDVSNVCSEGSVNLKWNRDEKVRLCPGGDGNFSAALNPEIGINVGTIEVEKNGVTESKSFTIGYGKLLNPYIDEEKGWVKNGLGVHVGADFLNETIRPLVNDYINSGKWKDLLTKMLEPTDGSEGTDENYRSEINEIKNELPFCKGDDYQSPVRFKLSEDPKLEWGEIERFRFKTGEIGLKVNLLNFELKIRMYRDENGDNLPDGKIIPLLLSFRGLTIDGKVQFMPDGRPLILLTSDSNDCDFINGAYCENKPALLTPANIVGGATLGGNFVRCDDISQQIDNETKDMCRDINRVNAQTGAISLEILRKLNELLYCQGSAVLTYAAKHKLKDIGGAFKLLKPDKMHVSGGADILNGKISVTQNGIDISAPARFGGSKIVSELDASVVRSDVGILSGPANNAAAAIGSGSIGLSLAEDWLNQLLFQLAFQKAGKGILDWEISELFFNELGFDFVEKCDAFEPTPESPKPPVLCQLRPRVAELLGSVLTGGGYFTNKQPIMLKLEGSRKIAPRMKVYSDFVPYEVAVGDELRTEYKMSDIIELQVPDLSVSFYALETDENKDSFGNYGILRNNDGTPMIHSMIPGSTEPVPIIRSSATIIVAFELGELSTSQDDPGSFEIKVRPIPDFSKVIFNGISGGNATTIPDESLTSAFREKITYGIEIFGNPKDAISIKIPKDINLDLFDKLGPDKITFGRDGIGLSFPPEGGRVDISLEPKMR